MRQACCCTRCFRDFRRSLKRVRGFVVFARNAADESRADHQKVFPRSPPSLLNSADLSSPDVPPQYVSSPPSLLSLTHPTPPVVSEELTFPPNLVGEARRILTSLLQKNPAQRLGSHGAEEIRRHLFFHGLDWNALANRRIMPPFRPSVESEF